MTEVNKIEDGKVEIITTLDGDRWNEAQKKAFNKLAKNVEIKGFRKGQAPRHLVEQRVTTPTVLAQAAEDVVDEVFRAALDETEVELIDRASMDIKAIDEAHVEFTFTCPVKPDVTLGEYKGLGYNPKEAIVEDSEIDSQIDQILNSKADLEIKEDGEVEDGDTVVIDYEGFKDGEAFEGGKDENYDLVIGSKTFIPGFEDALIGMKSEETKDIELTFPEDYHAEDLKGQKVIFKVTVHEIKKKVLPDLNDELVKELSIENVSTPDELKDYIKNVLLDRKKRQYEEEATNELLDKIVEGASVNIPDVMIDDEAKQIINEMANDMQRQGFSMQDYMKITGLTTENLKENVHEDAKNRVKLRLILEEIAKQEDVEITEEDVKCEIEDMANKYQMKVEDIENLVDKRMIINDLRMQKALEIIKA